MLKAYPRILHSIEAQWIGVELANVLHRRFFTNLIISIMIIHLKCKFYSSKTYYYTKERTYTFSNINMDWTLNLMML